MHSVLFIHENFPAQFGAFAKFLAGQGWRVVFATAHESFVPGKPVKRDGMTVVRYRRAREPKASHVYLQGTERALLNGQALARLGIALSKKGFRPDIVVAHSGWGSGSFARVVWPNAKLVQYLEWWYRFPPVDAAAGEIEQYSVDEAARTLVKNLPFLLDFRQADLVITPTAFQARQLPDFVRDNLFVQHDGVNCHDFRPASHQETGFTWEGLPPGAPVVTFATRGMEPTRGFPDFMAAAARL
ncbi:glycosyltransferase [uncultured Roseobacter sp.]|uniref:glycosyltransferase n=1 Tax=uncultured Roseobacter sp. TaxID=114847 RepID=UPI002613DBEA|nr:glycosyltransferase [uncultured Roseobacter sp.]